MSDMERVGLDDFRIGFEPGHVIANVMLLRAGDEGSTAVDAIAVVMDAAEARELAGDLIDRADRADRAEEGRE